MISAQTLLLYFLPGCAVAVALYVADRHGKGERLYVVFSAVLFWPIYLPGLLADRGYRRSSNLSSVRPKDEMDNAIDQAEADLSSALAGLEGWAGGAMAGEALRIHELRHAWKTLADRIREMDRLLGASEAEMPTGLLSVPADESMSQSARERLQKSIEIRRQNLERLGNVRRRAYEDLMGTLAWVRELISMIHLARFTGAPAARVQELISQIASAVEALSEVSVDETEAESAAESSEQGPGDAHSPINARSSACPQEMSPAANS